MDRRDKGRGQWKRRRTGVLKTDHSHSRVTRDSRRGRGEKRHQKEVRDKEVRECTGTERSTAKQRTPNPIRRKIMRVTRVETDPVGVDVCRCEVTANLRKFHARAWCGQDIFVPVRRGMTAAWNVTQKNKRCKFVIRCGDRKNTNNRRNGKLRGSRLLSIR